RLTRAALDQVVAENDKKRFEIDAAGTRIRASQGHSVPVELGYPVAAPPALLYHGTIAASLDSIFRSGLEPGSRHHVHLSADQVTATRVGSRRGRAVVLEVAAERMAEDGHEFHVSTNGVWLTATVPPAYLRRLTEPAVE
ncbi:MAG: RNA 2'-phosphotransferase, partial [Actinocrinis sp.]